MKIRPLFIFLFIMYLIGFCGIAYLTIDGWDYYLLPIKERPHSVQHSMLKPGGMLGHGVGIIGTAMILLLFVYSARKRNYFGLRFGRLSNWLNIHIYLGIMGPLLITVHTAGKLHGLVAISYYSMAAVMLSGILGRYIYIQIPRDESGDELEVKRINEKSSELNQKLAATYQVPDEVMSRIGQLTHVYEGVSAGGASALVSVMIDDLTRPFRFFRLKRFIERSHPEISAQAVGVIMAYSRKKSLLYRRRAFLKPLCTMFHYWHVIHKPFAWTMILVMIVHVTITVLMGYKWIF